MSRDLSASDCREFAFVLLERAEDLPVHSTARNTIATEASAYAALALYVPAGLVLPIIEEAPNG